MVSSKLIYVIDDCSYFKRMYIELEHKIRDGRYTAILWKKDALRLSFVQYSDTLMRSPLEASTLGKLKILSPPTSSHL